MKRSLIRLSCWCLVIANLGCEGRPRTLERTRPLSGLGHPEKNVVFDLTANVPETTTSGELFPLAPERTYAGLVRALEQASREPAPGYFVRLGTNSFDWAQTEEIGRLLGALRGEAHPVVCHADAHSNASMLLAATGCDEIWLSPAGTVDTVGIAGQSVYLKRLLERFKIKADFLHVGRYKSAGESLTEDEPSEAAKESMRAVLESIRTTWLDGIRAHRSEPRADQAVENGPWVPKAALAVGLVDRIGYESEARARLQELSQRDGFESAFAASRRQQSALDLAELLRTLSGAASSLHQPHVAVLPAQGGITMGGGGGFSEDGIPAVRFIQLIRDLAKDDAVKAVVLRIDSPGGSALASDLLWHELMRLREKKPLIASVGNMAASGGYYMASAAHAVVAERTSIVGSIGVMGGKLVIDEALSEFGVTTHTFTAKDESDDGARAAYLSALKGWDDATRQRVQEQMNAIYDLFIDRVAEGRGTPREQVLPSAEGRIWTGAQGQERGLVDRLGGLSEALAEAKQRAGLPADAPVTLEGPAGSLLEMLGLGKDADPEQAKNLISPQAQRPVWWGQLSKGQRAAFTGLLPLLAGERVLAVSSHLFELE